MCNNHPTRQDRKQRSILVWDCRAYAWFFVQDHAELSRAQVFEARHYVGVDLCVLPVGFVMGRGVPDCGNYGLVITFVSIPVYYCAPWTTESALIVSVMAEFSSMLICFE